MCPRVLRFRRFPGNADAKDVYPYNQSYCRGSIILTGYTTCNIRYILRLDSYAEKIFLYKKKRGENVFSRFSDMMYVTRSHAYNSSEIGSQYKFPSFFFPEFLFSCIYVHFLLYVQFSHIPYSATAVFIEEKW